MSDQGEKTCPLCAEEMDLTDQQLKPCKCGYEICVWCWHHIMDMAEKDDTDGRCPACRIPYDKEKIVGMASKNERLVAEIHSDKKIKSQKAKPKTAEGRKHLSSVRVIQRNLVYIIGIPSNLADEDLLQRKEYFAQYGKVLKVSIARTAGGAIQHSPNNTCSVYITYSKEEEAVRCIQLVHGYVLEGKPLRACFGTTKYCHAWLRNMTCSNPDCLYLHDIGTQEDSFTKDEIISAYTRSRVQQITGATNNLQRRSGNMLPPPMDDFYINSSVSTAKPIAKSASNNPVSQPKGSPPNVSSGRSVALPAAASWGLRVSNGRPSTAGSTCSNEPSKQKVDTYNGTFPAVVGNTTQVSTLHTDVGTKSFGNEESRSPHCDGGLGPLESSKPYATRDCRTSTPDSLAEVVRNAAPLTTTSSSQLPCRPTFKDSDSSAGMHPNISHTEELCTQAHPPASDANVNGNGTIHSLSSSLKSLDIDKQSGVEKSDVSNPNGADSSVLASRSPGSYVLQHYYTEPVKEPLSSSPSRRATEDSDGVSTSKEIFDWRSESTGQASPNARNGVEEVLGSDEQRFNTSNHVTQNSLDTVNSFSASISGNVDPRTMHTEGDQTSGRFISTNSSLPNGYDGSTVMDTAELGMMSGNSSLFSSVDKGKYSARSSNSAFDNFAITDMGESSIISNILSMDFDVWDDSLTSPHNLVKLLNDTDKQHGSLKLPSSLKVQNSNQSRFSFARHEDFTNHGSESETSFSNLGQLTHHYPASHDAVVDRDPYGDNLRNGYPSSIFGEDTFQMNLSFPSSNKFSAPRAQVSAPPGFSVPNRVPPPGFSVQERMDQAFESFSGNHLSDNCFMRNQYLGQTGNIADVELNDPAILAVGKERLPNGITNSGLDMRTAYTPQFSPSENEHRLQLLMQQSLSAHQNMRYPDHADSYRVQSRYLDQNQTNNLSSYGQLSLQHSRNAHMSNGRWDSWDEVQSGNKLAMAELLRNERLGLNKHYPSYEDLNFRMSSSGDMYKRAYGI